MPRSKGRPGDVDPLQGQRPGKQTGKVQPNVGKGKFTKAKPQKMTRKPVAR
jgi:hypothetical protein